MIYNYSKFVLLTESNNFKTLMTSFDGKKVDFYNTFNISEKLDSLETLEKNDIFNNNLKELKFKKNKIEYSDNIDTFLENSMSLKYILIFSIAKYSYQNFYHD